MAGPPIPWEGKMGVQGMGSRTVLVVVFCFFWVVFYSILQGLYHDSSFLNVVGIGLFVLPPTAAFTFLVTAIMKVIGPATREERATALRWIKATVAFLAFCTLIAILSLASGQSVKNATLVWIIANWIVLVAGAWLLR